MYCINLDNALVLGMNLLTNSPFSPPDDVFAHKESLPPPASANVTWPEYTACPPGEHPILGRKPVFKESSKAFKATVAMSEEFPLSIAMLLNVLEVSWGLVVERRRFYEMHLVDVICNKL